MANSEVILGEDIVKILEEYDKNPENYKFPLGWGNLYVYIGKKPKNNPLPLGTHKGKSIYLGGDEELE